MKNDNKEPLSAEEEILKKCFNRVYQWGTTHNWESFKAQSGGYQELKRSYDIIVESLKKEREWIPVSERLPEPDQTRIRCFYKNRFFYATFGILKYFKDDNGLEVQVSHWKPCDSPPNQ
jgi:hypothetical protein